MTAAGGEAPVGWRLAMQTALYGPRGFYVVGEGPRRHFRTSVTASPVFAGAVHRLAATVDSGLGAPARFDVVDVGAGDGTLLSYLVTLLSDDQHRRWRLHGVDLRGRPAALPGAITWSADPPDRIRGLLLAHELLDDVPVDVVQQGPDGPRLVEVAVDGSEGLGGRPDRADLAWLERWWPMGAAAVGDRAEVGRERDALWAGLVRRVGPGVAVAVDYSHARADRAAGRWSAGTLTGYRAGQQVPPVPDGSCDLTAHVALDACEAAGLTEGATDSLLTEQRSVLRALGVSGALPDPALARVDPAGYLEALGEASEAAELLRRGGLGDFGWLIQSVACLPPLDPGAVSG